MTLDGLDNEPTMFVWKIKSTIVAVVVNLRKTDFVREFLAQKVGRFEGLCDLVVMDQARRKLDRIGLSVISRDPQAGPMQSAAGERRSSETIRLSVVSFPSHNQLRQTD